VKAAIGRGWAYALLDIVNGKIRDMSGIQINGRKSQWIYAARAGNGHETCSCSNTYRLLMRNRDFTNRVGRREALGTRHPVPEPQYLLHGFFRRTPAKGIQSHERCGSCSEVRHAGRSSYSA
jgi:hypothetical protein